MLNRSITPVQHPISEIQLAKPRQLTLHNQIPFFIIDNENLDLIHFLIQLNVGILHENQKHIALFTYALLKESSKDHSSNEIADLLDFYGTHYTVSESLDKTVVSISVPKKNVKQILPVIMDFMSHPVYRETNLSVYKNLKIKDLEYNSQKTDVRNTQLMLHAMFGDDTTAGQFSTKENLQAVTIPQMMAFHQRTFCAENISLFATGNFDAELESFVCEIFEQIPNGVATSNIENLPLPSDTTPLVFEKMENSVQSSITLCQPMMAYSDAERREFSILSTITGGYFGSRLMQNLREKNGYTYGISSGSVYFGNQSIFIVNSDVNIQNTKASMEACFEELERLRLELVPQEELDSVRNYILGELLRDVENSVSYLKRLAYWHHHQLDESEFHTMIQIVRDITAEQILFLAKKHYPHNKFTQIIVGDNC